LEKRKEIDHLEYPDVGGGMALIEILKTWVVMECIGLNYKSEAGLSEQVRLTQLCVPYKEKHFDQLKNC
jgi:hypothetical protein